MCKPAVFMNIANLVIHYGKFERLVHRYKLCYTRSNIQLMNEK